MTTRLSVLALVLAFSVGWAVEFSQLHAYRDINGKYTAESTSNIEEMALIADSEGHINLWVTFDMDFTGNPAERTRKVVQQEARTKRQLINTVIIPLRRDAKLLKTPTGLEEAPGCLVRATTAGLRGLVNSESVKHISWYAPSNEVAE